MSADNVILYKKTLRSFVASADKMTDDEEDALTRELDRLWYGLSVAEREEVERFGSLLSQGQVSVDLSRVIMVAGSKRKAFNPSARSRATHFYFIQISEVGERPFGAPLDSLLKGINDFVSATSIIAKTENGGKFVSSINKSRSNVDWKTYGATCLRAQFSHG